MYSKILALTLFAAALGLVLLGMRQQRLELMHEITLLFRQSRRTQHDLWELQARTAAAVNPRKIESAATEAGLELTAPGVGETPEHHRLVAEISAHVETVEE